MEAPPPGATLAPSTLVSVLLPIRDAGATLDACLESLAAQSLGDLEIVAVDHGSQDATPAILARWTRQLPHLRLLHHEGGSLLDALNAGLAHCRGRYIARMDSDDLCLPARLQVQADLLQSRPEVDLVSSRVEFFGPAPLSPGILAYQSWVNGLLEEADILRELFIECPLPHPSWMLRRELFERLGGYQDPDLPEDYHFLLRAAAAGARLAKVPEVLLRWRDHPGRHSRTHPRYSRHAFFHLKAHFIPALLLKGRRACVWGAGDRGRLLVRYLLEEGVDLEFVVAVAGDEDRPTVAHGIPVIAPEQLPARLPGPLLACVGTPGARPRLRDWAAQRGWKEGEDYFFCS